jgi:hypothetical protein
MFMTSRRQALGALLLLGGLQMQAADMTVHVYKTPTCGCCGKWVEHMRANGFKVEVTEVQDTAETRRKYGVPEELRSCHTAVVDGYALEGHVPAADVKQLLQSRPKAKGIAVPGMPMGSPGMEVEGGKRQAFQVMLFNANGALGQFNKYEGK